MCFRSPTPPTLLRDVTKFALFFLRLPLESVECKDNVREQSIKGILVVIVVVGGC